MKNKDRNKYERVRATNPHGETYEGLLIHKDDHHHTILADDGVSHYLSPSSWMFEYLSPSFKVDIWARSMTNMQADSKGRLRGKGFEPNRVYKIIESAPPPNTSPLEQLADIAENHCHECGQRIRE